MLKKPADAGWLESSGRWYSWCFFIWSILELPSQDPVLPVGPLGTFLLRQHQYWSCSVSEQKQKKQFLWKFSGSFPPQDFLDVFHDNSLTFSWHRKNYPTFPSFPDKRPPWVQVTHGQQLNTECWIIFNNWNIRACSDALCRSGNRTVLEMISLDRCSEVWSHWILHLCVQHAHPSHGSGGVAFLSVHLLSKDRLHASLTLLCIEEERLGCHITPVTLRCSGRFPNCPTARSMQSKARMLHSLRGWRIGRFAIVHQWRHWNVLISWLQLSTLLYKQRWVWGRHFQGQWSLRPRPSKRSLRPRPKKGQSQGQANGLWSKGLGQYQWSSSPSPRPGKWSLIIRIWPQFFDLKLFSRSRTVQGPHHCV